MPRLIPKYTVLPDICKNGEAVHTIAQKHAHPGAPPSSPHSSPISSDALMMGSSQEIVPAFLELASGTADETNRSSKLNKDDADSDSQNASLPSQFASSNIRGYISENYTMLTPTSCNISHSSCPQSLPKSSTRNSPHKRPARFSLPVIEETSSLVLAAPATSPECSPETNFASLHLAAPPGMGHGVGSAGHKTSSSELAGLVLQLREERRGNTLLAQRIRDLESVVREQENIMRETESKIPRSPLEWGVAALKALSEGSHDSDFHACCDFQSSSNHGPAGIESNNWLILATETESTSVAPQGPPPIGCISTSSHSSATLMPALSQHNTIHQHQHVPFQPCMPCSSPLSPILLFKRSPEETAKFQELEHAERILVEAEQKLKHANDLFAINSKKEKELITLAKGIMLAKQLDRKSSEGSCKDSTCQCQDEVKPKTFLPAGLPSMDASADKAIIALLQQQLAESKEDLTRLEHKLDATERLKDTLNLEVSQLKAALNHARSTAEQTSVSQTKQNAAMQEQVSVLLEEAELLRLFSGERSEREMQKKRYREMTAQLLDQDNLLRRLSDALQEKDEIVSQLNDALHRVEEKGKRQSIGLNLEDYMNNTGGPLSQVSECETVDGQREFVRTGSQGTEIDDIGSDIWAARQRESNIDWEAQRERESEIERERGTWQKSLDDKDAQVHQLEKQVSILSGQLEEMRFFLDNMVIRG